MVLPKLSNHSRLDLSLGWLYKLPLSLLQQWGMGADRGTERQRYPAIER